MDATLLPHSRFVECKDGVVHVNATNLHYRELNRVLRCLGNPEKTVHVINVLGQRYIGTDINSSMELHIYGTPGNDLAAFMDGGKIVVHGNSQDGVGNTMNSGVVIVQGRAGDIVGHSMRGGEIYIRDDVGYRCGIHMKQYRSQIPMVVVGGAAQDYLGEYMAGGILVVLGLDLGAEVVHRSRFVGAGMHGGVIYLRGKPQCVCKNVKVKPLENEDVHRLKRAVNGYCEYFDMSSEAIELGDFVKLAPLSIRPYEGQYAR